MTTMCLGRELMVWDVGGVGGVNGVLEAWVVIATEFNELRKIITKLITLIMMYLVSIIVFISGLYI